MKNFVLQLQTAPAIAEFDKTTTPHMTRYRKELIKVGKYVKDSVGLSFEVTREILNHWVDTFDRWVSNGNKVPVPLGHAAADSPEKNQGWLRSLSVAGDSLFGVMELIDPDLALTTDVSIYVPAEFTDGHGAKYIQPIAHVALCTNPVIPGLKGFQKLSLSLGDDDVKDLKKELCGLLDLTDADDDAIVAAVKLIKTPAKLKTQPKTKALSQASELTATSPIVKLVMDNRTIKVAALVQAGVITPATKTAIEKQYVVPEALALSMSIGYDDGFDFLMTVLAESKAVKLGEKSDAQLLELANTRATGAENPIAADVNRRRVEAGVDKQ